MESKSGRRYETLSSGEAFQVFETGAQRDSQAGKPRYDLIPPEALRRLAELFARGAEKYDDHNWAKGMPSTRVLASLYRHLEQYRTGDKTEDHLAAVAWNAFVLMHFEDTEFDDFYDWSIERGK
jgi:hypothetical protein